ncbi:MAG: hypothetical protein VX620_15355 [Pseudomonadota bacterium]|nr:hypothetical protein [Pseudomonadota bacterium]
MSPRYMPGDTLILRDFPSKAAQNRHAIDATVTTQSGKTVIGTILHADAKGITLLQLSPAKRVFICAKEKPILCQIIAATRPKTAVFSAKTNDTRLRSA